MKKVLFITEASYLSTGYAAYGREVIPRLIKMGYDVAEFSVYGTYNDPRRAEIPWKNYPNMPGPEESEMLAKYREKPVNQFGAWRFERACIDFQPDVVLSIRDVWMDSFIMDSPYRPYFNFIWMPTVDGMPQSDEWINTFKQCDALLTYSEWGGELLYKQMGDIPYFGAAPACGAKEYVPIDKTTARDTIGLRSDAKIVGTVMRNQRRKLFDDLFVMFRQYLDITGDTNTYLYCHTSYPDNGWPLGQYLIEQGLSSKVLFTYMCEACDHTFASFFSDTVRVCPKCNKFACKTSNVNKGASRETLANIYNSFDLYVQYHNSEGQAIPPWEAVSCGVPTAVINYSATEDMIKNFGVIPLDVKTLYREMETGCYRAVPDNDANAVILGDILSRSADKRKSIGSTQKFLMESYVSWDKTTQKWSDAIDSCGEKKPWNSPPMIRRELEPDKFPQMETNQQFLTWCFEKYLMCPEKVGSYQYRMLLRDYNNGMFKPNPGGFFYSDSSISGRQDFKPFNREMLCKMMTGYAQQYNFWEKARTGQIPLRRENWL